MFRGFGSKKKKDASSTVEEDSAAPQLASTVGPGTPPVAKDVKDSKKDSKKGVSKRKSESDISRRKRSETAPPPRNATMTSLPISEATSAETLQQTEASKPSESQDKDKDKDKEKEKDNDFSFGSDSDSEDDRPKLNVVIKSKEEAISTPTDEDNDFRLDDPSLSGLVSPRSRSTATITRTRARGRTATISSPTQPDQTSSQTSLPDVVFFPSPASEPDPKLVEASSPIGQVNQLFDNCLRASDLQSALELTESSLRLLAQVKPLPSQHVRFVVVYRTAIRLLQAVELQDEANNSNASSRLLRILADLPLLPHHRVVALRMAIARHLVVENYGVAAHLIRIAIVRVPVAEFQDDLALCQSKNEANASNGNDDDCDKLPPEYFDCTTRLRFCSKSFAILIVDEQAATQCPACSSIFAAESTPSGSPCSECFSGSHVE